MSHEKFLKKALLECKISQLVSDLGNLYVLLGVYETNKDSDEGFRKALKVCRILQDASRDIALLGEKPRLEEPFWLLPNQV